MATKAPLGNGQFGGILVVLTVSADQFASFVTFECPCDREINQYYALTFLLGPSIILFLMALLKQQMFWRLVTGACRSTSAFGGNGTSYMKGLMKWLTIISIALPAAVVWFLIQMLKGDLYSCAFWPEGDCDNSTVFVEPCKAPKTVGVDLDTCNAQYNRDLHATSHMIAWAGICMGGVLLVGVFVIQKSLSPYSYLQTMWVGEYRKAEFDAFKRKIKLRANDLASELVNEYLREERDQNEWNRVSTIALPTADPHCPDQVLLSPLCKWADEEADKSASKLAKQNGTKASAANQSAFYFLEPGEMTFDKERNPPPPVTEHHVKFFADGDFAQKLVSAVAASEKQ